MNPRGLLAWPFLVCYLLLAFTVLAKDSNDNRIPLKVSIRKDALQGAPSCQHTFGQIELLNSHHSEHIMIYSIQTTPEESKLIRSVQGGSGNNSSWESIPQQLHVSRLPSGSLSLGPGQVAIVPLTYLPRYPELEHDNLFFTGEIKQPPTITPTARTDLENLLGAEVLSSFEKQRRTFDPASIPSKRRNNLEPSALPSVNDFRVSTSVVVETSKGVVETPISATSSRQNDYAIPDVIRFHHSSPPEKSIKDKKSSSNKTSKRTTAKKKSHGVEILESIRFEEPTDINPGARTTLNRSIKPRDCYDVYISNPLADRDLEVSEVLISRHELMSVEVDPNRLALPPDSTTFSSEPSQVIRQWTEEGSLFLPPDSTDNYVATVCTAPNGVEFDEAAGAYLEEMNNWIDSGDPEVNLGFMQIRTDIETLFISLERYLEAEEDIYDSRNKTESKGIETTPPASKLLKASVEELDFLLISSSSPPSFVSIDLHNKSPVPIRIMRVSVGLTTQNDLIHAEKARLLGLEFTIERGNKQNLDPESQCNRLESILLPAASTIKDALEISCRTFGNPALLSLHEESFHFSGVVVIRGTMDTELTYEDWKAEMARDPFRDIHVTIEIPYKVEILNGRVEVTLERSTHPYPQTYASQNWDNYGRAVATLFFPEKAYDATEDSEAPLPTQMYRNSREIAHDLRVMSNLALPIQLSYAEIVDEHGSTEFDKDSVCARFNVSRARAFEPVMTYPEFDDLEFISLQYKFKSQKERTTGTANSTVDGPLLPSTCYLHIVTSPKETGYHRIPLIVFPAELEISSPSSVGKAKSKAKPGKAVLTGYDSLLSWFRSTIVGQSLFEILWKSSGDPRKSDQTEDNILTSYIRRLCQTMPEREKQRQNPILFNLGAIKHSEIARAPLYFTNHNPIPITVTINIGEVEGMAIALGKDESQGRGDGNSLVDYLPERLESSRSGDLLVGEGTFEGHPVDGLRQFLLSNAEALGFSDRFPFRDAVSLNHEAVSKQPILTQLYQWHSYAEFRRHRRKLPESSTSYTSNCDLSSYPPQYSSRIAQIADPKHRLPGAIVISSDKQLTRRLEICDKNDPKSRSLADGNQVLIPPGGTARFEVSVRSPPESLLKNDISQLLATGLVLSTNLGDAMPIFASFEALQGHLYLWNEPNATEVFTSELTVESDGPNLSYIHVPVSLGWDSETELAKREFGDVAHHLRNPGKGDGVGLQLGSSFSRSIRLLDVDSCNDMFNVELSSKTGVEMMPNLSTRVGSIEGVARCTSDYGDKKAFPSFFRCALNWLSQRSKNEGPDCMAPNLMKSTDAKVAAVDASPRQINRVVSDLEEALLLAELYASVSFSGGEPNGLAIEKAFFLQESGNFAIKSGRTRSGGYMDVETLRVFAKASNSWKRAASMGLTTMNSRLRATLEYHPTDNQESNNSAGIESQQLSLSMHNTVAQASLEQPGLFAGSIDEIFGVGVIDFQSVRVGDTISMMVPIHNPTSVPIRVRLAASQLRKEPEEGSSSELDAFLMGKTQPFVQSQLGSESYGTLTQPLWWDGGGSFWLPDWSGDILRSHHNVTIRAGPDAHVSLINPSLQTVNGFILGCGSRCGLRDDGKVQEQEFDPQHRSVIGAAAAAGITLAGRKREETAEMNEPSGDEPFLFAGGVPFPHTGGPPAFAIPVSALDEIVLPPHGYGELGPVFFRPPGRYGTIGCKLAKDSGATHWSDKTKQLCDTNGFESMLLLENSLIGVERVLLRGKSRWNQLYFLDPPPREGENAFGDIELRNGQSTLVFSGSGMLGPKRGGKRKVTPVIKQVLLHNDGDDWVHIKKVYLSDSSMILKQHQATKRTHSKGCQMGSFQLLDCWDSEAEVEIIGGVPVSNIQRGFALGPGDSRSFFVEHFPDCSREQEFISLNVEVSQAGMFRGRIEPQEYVQLMVGYQMNSAQYDKCAAVNWDDSDYYVLEPSTSNAFSGENATYGRKRRLSRGQNPSTNTLAKKSLPLFAFLTMCSVAMVLLFYSGKSRRESLQKAISRDRPGTNEEGKTTERKRPTQKSLWNAAFRCLARADPNSTELQTLGREQIRQVVVGRYRAKGVLPPSSMATRGAVIRDRPLTGNTSESRQRGKEGTTGSDRIRTLSDALFGNLHGNIDENIHSKVPSGLGWRVAYAQGIIDDQSVTVSAVGNRVRQYKNKMRKGDSDHKKELVARDVVPNLSFERNTQNYTKPTRDPSTTDSMFALQTNSTEETNVDDQGTWDSVRRSTQSSPPPGGRRSEPTDSTTTEDQARNQLSLQQGQSTKTTKTNSSTDRNESATVQSTAKAATKQDGKPAASWNEGNEQDHTRRDNRALPSQQRKQHVPKETKATLKSTVTENAWGSPPSVPLSKGKSSSPAETMAKSSSKKSDRKMAKAEGKKKKDNLTVAGKLSKTGKSPEVNSKTGVESNASSSKVDSLQPPPGLAPPPGFKRDESTNSLSQPTLDLSLPLANGQENASLGDMLTAALKSDMKNKPSPSTLPFGQQLGASQPNLFFTGGLGEAPTPTSIAESGDMQFGTIPNSNTTEEVIAPASDPLLDNLLRNPDNSHKAFDVMDFLDSILDDGKGGAPETTTERLPSQSPGLISGSGSEPPATSSNPWATERRSRASAYGISFEENEDGGGASSATPSFPLPPIAINADDNSLGNIPLLTPAAILLSQQQELATREEDLNEDDRALSFYTSLIDD